MADFFQKHNVAVMTVRELFEFITDPSITSENIDDYLSKVRPHGLVTEKRTIKSDLVQAPSSHLFYIPL